MTLPVTGPFIVQVNGTTGTDKEYYSWKSGYRQRRPYDLTLAFERKVATGGTVGSPPYGCGSVLPPGYMDAINWSDATNKLLDKFKGKLGEEAGMAVNILERKQSLAMIATRGAQMGAFVLALSRLNFVRAASILRMSAVPKGASVRKSVANNWLEFHFGWSPLVSDIHAAVEILQGPVPPIRVRATQTLQGSDWFVAPVVKRTNPNAFNAASSTETWTKRRVFDVSVACGARVRVTNPNLWLANQLGFVNPLVVGYNVIPFSFVLDWFINVEQFLSQGTDFLGLAVEQPWTTKRYRAVLDHRDYVTMRYWAGGQYPNDRYTYVTTQNDFLGQAIHVRRSLGLPAVVLKWRPLKLPSWQRALTSVSLVVQKMRKAG